MVVVVIVVVEAVVVGVVVDESISEHQLNMVMKERFRATSGLPPPDPLLRLFPATLQPSQRTLRRPCIIVVVVGVVGVVRMHESEEESAEKGTPSTLKLTF